MVISQDKKEHVVIIGLEGRLDVLNSKSLLEKIETLVAEKEHHLVIDFANLDFISSSGLRVLLSTAKMINGVKGKLALCSLKDRVKDVFDIAGFTMLFSIFPSEEKALEHMK